VKKKVVELFGQEIVTDNQVKKKKISEIVFNNPQKLAALNHIIHPAVAKDFNSWLKKQNAAYILKEAAILFESGANKQMDKVIWVSAPEELRIARVLKRGGLTLEEIKNRLKNQKKEEELMLLADFVIKNNESDTLIDQALKINDILEGK